MPSFARFKNKQAVTLVFSAAAIVVAFFAFALAFLLADGLIVKIATAIGALVVLAILIFAEFQKRSGLAAWAYALRPAALLLIIFVLATSGAAVTTFLRIPPTLTGIGFLIPFMLLILADTHRSPGIRTRPMLDACMISVLAVEITIALLALPLTFSAVGALVACVVASLREVVSRLDRGVLTTRFGFTLLGVFVAVTVVLVGTSKWS